MSGAGKSLTHAERKRRLAAVGAGDFMALVDAAGLDPAVHFRHFDWSGTDFSGLNLRGFDFTGARLHGCRFDKALIGPGSDRHGRPSSGARFDGAELGRVLHDRIIDQYAAAPMTPVANLPAASDWKEHIRTWERAPQRPRYDNLPVGTVFSDAPGVAPEMVVVPAGTFLMGTSSEDIAARIDRFEQCPVTIAQPFAVGRFAVTFEEWDWAQHHPDWQRLSGIAPRRLDDRKWDHARRPVINVSWHDVQAYVRWLSALTAQIYRLLAEAEWEYACRAGTTTAYSTGDEITSKQAQFSAKQTLNVGSFPSNAWGLFDMHGNVWEWCHDAWYYSYDGAPDDGTARDSGDINVARVLRGGSWHEHAEYLRSAHRSRLHPGIRDADYGFRLARTLIPAP